QTSRTPALPQTVSGQSRCACGCCSRPDVTDAVDHAEFATAIPHERLAAFVEHRLVRAVNGDVVDDVVGDHGVARAHHRHRPPRPERIDGVAGAVDQQRGAIAVDRLLETNTGDVRIAVFGVPGRRAGGGGD